MLSSGSQHSFIFTGTYEIRQCPCTLLMTLTARQPQDSKSATIYPRLDYTFRLRNLGDLDIQFKRLARHHAVLAWLFALRVYVIILASIPRGYVSNT